MTTRYTTFLGLVSSGLWERDISIPSYGAIDYAALYDMASEQTVVGLAAAGIEYIKDTKVGKLNARPFLVHTIQIEQRNASMNEFIVWLFQRLQEEGITAIVVKGQGIAQCYERPQWRAAGDIDLLLDQENYLKAQKVLTEVSSSCDPENPLNLHQAMQIGGFDVELHGTLRTNISKRMDVVIDEVQDNMFRASSFRQWQNNGVAVPLPNPDDDVIFVFTHILDHFFGGGIGLRQICDWCRLLWTYRDSIDREKLDLRLRQMGIVSEWKAFASLAVHELGAPAKVIPFYSEDKKWRRKASKILSYIFETGNFGHNRDSSYNGKYPLLICRMIRLWGHVKDNFRLIRIFPADVTSFFFQYFVNKLKELHKKSRQEPQTI